jgi:hypothetical protein
MTLSLSLLVFTPAARPVAEPPEGTTPTIGETLRSEPSLFHLPFDTAA